MMKILVSTGLNGLYVKLIIQVKLDAPKKRTHIYKKLLAIYLVKYLLISDLRRGAQFVLRLNRVTWISKENWKYPYL